MSVETAAKAVELAGAKTAEQAGLGEHLIEKLKIIEGFNLPQISAFDINIGSFHYHVNAFTIHINESVLTMWILTLFIIAGAYLITRKFETFPTKLQNFAELIVEGVSSLCKSMIGHHYKPFVAYFGTIFIFLAFANTIGMLGIPEFYIGGFLFPGLRPPTKDINLPAAMAIMTLVLIIGSTLKYKGIGGMVKSWFEPIPIMLPFKLMEYIIKPMSLCLRLFGNVFGAFVMMELIVIVSNKLLLPPVFSLYFDIFDGLLQAFIFTFLSMLYIGEAIE